MIDIPRGVTIAVILGLFVQQVYKVRNARAKLLAVDKEFKHLQTILPFVAST
jgi:hypothetical protein